MARWLLAGVFLAEGDGDAALAWIPIGPVALTAFDQ